MDLGAAVERRVGIAEYAREAGWILESRLYAFLFLGQHKEYLASVQFDGILSMVRSSQPTLREIVLKAGVPVVDLWQDCPELSLPRVYPDHHAAGRLAATHLIELGLRNLLFYSHTVDRRVTELRRNGFREMAKSRGLGVDEIWWDSHTPMPKGLTRVSWLAQQLKSRSLPVGVMAGNDAVASDVLDAAHLAGLRVPEDVAVVGVDNDPILAELGAVPLTSVEIARPRVGYEAAALLDRLIDGEKPPRHPILVPPAGVIARRSTEILAVSDADVLTAVRYIRDHFRESISVTDVAASTFLSQRRLQDRFQSALGHSILDEITRQRVNFARHLLTQTKHKIAIVATMGGFGSMHHMSKVFRRELKISPMAYRQKYRVDA